MKNRSAHLLPLGYQRLRLLGCLGADSPAMPGYFDPDHSTDIFAEFSRYVARMSQIWANETDVMTVSLLAAARVLTGELGAADIIISHLPTKAIKLDHGAGYCVVMPQTVLCTSLPLPAELKDIDHWLDGSGVQSALQLWLKKNNNKLLWDETKGVYLFPNDSTGI